MHYATLQSYAKSIAMIFYGRMVSAIVLTYKWVHSLPAVSMALMTSCSSFAAAINLLVMIPWSSRQSRLQSFRSVFCRKTLWLTSLQGSHWFAFVYYVHNIYLPGTSLAHWRRINGSISVSDQRFPPLMFLQVHWSPTKIYVYMYIHIS